MTMGFPYKTPHDTKAINARKKRKAKKKRIKEQKRKVSK